MTNWQLFNLDSFLQLTSYLSQLFFTCNFALCISVLKQCCQGQNQKLHQNSPAWEWLHIHKYYSKLLHQPTVSAPNHVVCGGLGLCDEDSLECGTLHKAKGRGAGDPAHNPLSMSPRTDKCHKAIPSGERQILNPETSLPRTKCGEIRRCMTSSSFLVSTHLVNRPLFFT